MPLFLKEQHGVKLVSGNFIEKDSDSDLQRIPKVKCASYQEAGF